MFRHMALPDHKEIYLVYFIFGTLYSRLSYNTVCRIDAMFALLRWLDDYLIVIYIQRMCLKRVMFQTVVLESIHLIVRELMSAICHRYYRGNTQIRLVFYFMVLDVALIIQIWCISVALLICCFKFEYPQNHNIEKERKRVYLKIGNGKMCFSNKKNASRRGLNEQRLFLRVTKRTLQQLK